ncbi:LOW QUALITY PROTEIN: hypoxia up-regulated protein 1-like [Pomacea canaliculata]|uniref:LOW QUALITY PROTEIN: hypoxia up-regulated protein 1-like n=1 Tax=Pomacea canaliculata TaxID=400727 RepID=UPI000D72C6AB|nr:LOW QUALITY PROTEIN: hypoxia up-regulated protein 1-like [Pomacea canaliculata]
MHLQRKWKFLPCFLFLGVFLPVSARLAVMSVDLGGEFIKIAIVKPGVPMEIVLNKESSRKTNNIIAFRNGERQFGNDAYNTAIKFPEKAFFFLLHVIGRQYDDPIVQQYRKRFPYYENVLVKDEERGTVLFKENDDTLYTPEELLGMILEQAQEYAQDFAGQEIKDAVITVPAYFNQAERRAVRTAAELAGINVLQLMSDNAAVALNYGVFRRKNFNSTTQYYAFYDMGTTSTIATVVAYQVVKMKEGTRVESNPQLTIKGVGYDRNLGGLEMTLRLRDYLADVFNSQNKSSNRIQTNPRAMAKLLKEAERVKKVLSANADHTAQVEGLFEEKDFQTKVTREQLLVLVDDLLQRVNKPLEEALKVSEITMDEISEVILMGGGTRTPMVQDQLLKATGRSELGKSINTDDAAALGAVYQAAYLGKGFKVKTFHVKEGNMFPINVEFEKQKSGDETADSGRTIKRTLFGRMNPFPQKKVMTFNKHFKDFTFDVRYGDLDFLDPIERKTFTSLSLSNISLQGVADALAKHGEEADYKGVKVHFRMDESGILHLEQVESVFEKQQIAEDKKEDESTWSKIGSAFGGLFGGSKEGEEDGSKIEPSVDEGERPLHGETNETVSSSDQSEQAKASSDGSEQADSKLSEEQKNEKPKVEPEEVENKEKEASEKPQEGEEKDIKEDTGSDKEEDKSDKKDDKASKKKEEKADAASKDTTDEKDQKDEKKAATQKTVTVRENLKVEVEVKDLSDLSKERLTQAKKRLAVLRKKDKEKADLEKAKNELEGFIFDTQDKLSQEQYEICSTEEERQNILQQLSEASDWLYDQPEGTKKEAFINKLKDLKELMKNINLRVYEKEERPKALEALKQHLNSTRFFLQTVKNMSSTEESIFTEVELKTLEKLVSDTEAWRDEALKEQAKVPDHENPTLLVETIGSKIYALDREMKYLINKVKSFRPKPKVDPKNTTTKEDKKDDQKSKSDTEEEKTDDEDGTVEEEDEADTVIPESQEAAPETAPKEDQQESTVKTPEAGSEKERSKTTDKKKKQPKQKQQQKSKTDQEEEVLEIGSKKRRAEKASEEPKEEL